MKFILFAAAMLAGPGLADCPEAPDISGEMDVLLGRIQAAESENAARLLSNRMWELWSRAPDARAQELLDDGMTRRAAFDLEGAEAAFDALVAYCPEFSEGYNQRAFAKFLGGRHAEALPDLDRAIELRPRHVAAISGRGLTLIQLGRIRDGQADIRAALALNPWLSERRFLALKPEAIDL